MSRPDPDRYFMGIAMAVRSRANCTGRRVGAIIVRDYRILSTGYNGTPTRMTNCEEGGCHRCAHPESYASGEGYDVCICVHAEQNALLAAARFGVAIEGCTLYTTLQPCFGCLKEAIQASVRRCASCTPGPRGSATSTTRSSTGWVRTDSDRCNPRTPTPPGPLARTPAASAASVTRRWTDRRLDRNWCPAYKSGMTFRAGAAQVVITPPVGTPLEGYGGRQGGAVGVHDDLHARALVVDDETTRAAVVGCDAVGVDRRLVATVRERAAEATGIPTANIMVCATHTHAGPAAAVRRDDPALTDVLARTIAGAIEAAYRDLQPAVLKAGAGSVDSVSQNRRDPNGPFDPAMRVLLFDAPDHREAPRGAIVNFACHPTVLYSTNMLVSADYPGHAMAAVQRALGGATPLFVNGACGDVNPAWIEQEHVEAERVGSIVGAEASRRLLELRPLANQHKVWNIRWDELLDKPVTSGALISSPSVKVLSQDVSVPLRALVPRETYDARLAHLEEERQGLRDDDVAGRRRVMEQITRFRTERIVAERLRPSDAQHLARAEVQVIRLGPGCAILGLPGEFFVETASAIQEAVAIPHLLVACYANHYMGYLVPRHAFDDGGYEPGVAVVDETAEETVRLAAIDLVRRAMR